MSANGYTEHILKEIAGERWRQLQEFSVEHDARLSPGQWIAIGCRHLGMGTLDGGLVCRNIFRRQLIRCAAVCAAAIEALDRQIEDALADGGAEYSRDHPPSPPDHLEKLKELLQEQANKQGEAVYLITADEVGIDGTKRGGPYGVLKSQSNAWEKTHVELTIEPQKGQP